MRCLILIAAFLVSSLTLNAQSFGELQREKFGKGLYKVHSGNHYGIFDNKDNVIVSVEYENILLQDGIAVLRKNNGCAYGSITEKGEVSFFKKAYRYHVSYPFYTEGYLPVKKNKESTREKWFFVDAKGERLNKNVDGMVLPLVFRSVMPFCDGYASVVNTKGEVLHIDSNGQSRFVIDDDVVFFRASVKDGEAVIVTRTGVKLYQEDKRTNKANVKRVISQSCFYKMSSIAGAEKILDFEDGMLYLDCFGRATKYVPRNGNPIVFGVEENKPLQKEIIHEPPTKTPTPVSFNIEEGLSLSLKHRVVSASSKGWAGVTILINNTSSLPTGLLTVKVISRGINPVESFINLLPEETQSIKISLPAKFTETQRNQEIVVEISEGSYVVEKKLNVVLKRYESTSIL